MELKFKEKTVYEVDYKDLEKFIEDYYDHPINLIEAWEMGNDTYNSLYIDGSIDKWDRAELKKFKEDGTYEYTTPCLILNDLVKRGEIEAGEYLVSICW